MDIVGSSSENSFPCPVKRADEVMTSYPNTRQALEFIETGDDGMCWETLLMCFCLSDWTMHRNAEQFPPTNQTRTHSIICWCTELSQCHHWLEKIFLGVFVSALQLGTYCRSRWKHSSTSHTEPDLSDCFSHSCSADRSIHRTNGTCMWQHKKVLHSRDCFCLATMSRLAEAASGVRVVQRLSLFSTWFLVICSLFVALHHVFVNSFSNISPMNSSKYEQSRLSL